MFKIGKVYERIASFEFTLDDKLEIKQSQKIIVLDLYATNGVKFLFDGKIYYFELALRNWGEVNYV